MLKQDNIQLRVPEPEDVDFLVNMENNSDLWHVSNTHNPFSRFDIEQYVLLADKDVYSAKQLRFIIEFSENGKPETVGAVDIFNFDAHNKRAGVGITIIEEHRNKGFAGTALEIIINYLFTHLNLHQIYCNIEKDNYNSISLFKSKGFEVAGIKRDWNLRSGKWIDELLFQLFVV